MTLRSLWQRRHDGDQPPVGDEAVAAVTGDWDVIVVGAGITGLTTAALLTASGHRVLVVEARRVGDGTTGGSTAKLSLLQGTQLTRIARRHPLPVLRDYVAANRAAQDWVVGVCAQDGVELQQRSAFTFATDDAGEQAVRRELHHARRAGLRAEWADDLDLPFATRGAVTLPEQWQTDPVALLAALRARVEAQGGAVAERARVTSVRGHRPIEVTTERGSARAATVVVATNSPILDRGGAFARVSAQRSYSLAFATPDPLVDAMYLSAGRPSRSLRDATARDGSALLLVGGEGHPVGREPVTSRRIETLRSWTRDTFGPLEEVAAWSAQDYVPHHALPWAGPLLPGRDDVLFAGGYSKWGMTNGVAAAHLLVGRIAGDVPEWGGPFTPWSSRELRGLPTAGAINAEVGLAMTLGWLRPLLHSAAAPPEEGEGRVGRDGLSTPTAVSTTDGTTRRVSAVCTHLGGIVSYNDAERSWDCPLHGSRFDTDGSVLEGVATCGLTRRT